MALILCVLFFGGNLQPTHANATSNTASVTDSLVKVLHQSPGDTAKVDLFYRLSWYLKFSHIDSALHYARDGVDLAREVGYGQGLAQNLKSLGDIYDMTGDYTRSVKMYRSALDIFKELNQARRVSKTNMAMGLTFFHVGDYARAMEYNQEALKIAREEGFKANIPSCQTNIGIIHRNQGNYERALEYYQRALEGFRAIGNKRNEVKAYSNLGVVHSNLGHYDTALIYYNKALDRARKLDIKPSRAIAYGNIAGVHEQQGRYRLALDYYRQAYHMFSHLGYKRRMAGSSVNMASVYYQWAAKEHSSARKQELLNQAMNYGRQGKDMAQRIGVLAEQQQALEVLSKVYARLNDYQRAYQLHRQFQALNDSLFNRQKSRQIEELAAKYRMQQQRKENQLLRKENELQQTQIERSRLLRKITVGVVLLVSAFSVVYFRRYRRQKRYARELREKNALIRQQTDQLNEMNHDKNRIISIISHDLRSPLSSILTSAHVLRKGMYKSQKEMSEFHYYIYKNASGLLHLLENLLSWAKNQQNQITFFPEQQPLYPVIDYNIEFLSNMARDKGVRLTHDLEDEHLEAVFDQNMISTVIRNLISNAIKFTPSGGQVKVHVHALNDRLEVGVSDTGMGIDQQEKQKILRGEVSQPQTGTELEKGSGIGLKVSLDFIHKHHGHLSINTEPGVGTTFRFTLPKPSSYDGSSSRGQSRNLTRRGSSNDAPG